MPEFPREEPTRELPEMMESQPRSITTLLPLLLPLIPELIALCKKQGNSDTAIRSALRNPTPTQQFRLERLVRQELEMGWFQWRRERDDIMPEVMARARTLSDDDVEAFMAEGNCCYAEKYAGDKGFAGAELRA